MSGVGWGRAVTPRGFFACKFSVSSACRSHLNMCRSRSGGRVVMSALMSAFSCILVFAMLVETSQARSLGCGSAKARRWPQDVPTTSSKKRVFTRKRLVAVNTTRIASYNSAEGARLARSGKKAASPAGQRARHG